MDAIDGPLLSLAVGLARMVHEASQVALRSRIDYKVLFHTQEVVVLVAITLLLLHAPLELGMVDHLAHVLDDKVTHGYGLTVDEAKSSLVHVDHLQTWRLALLKHSILAKTASLAVLRIAFIEQHAVKAASFRATGMLVHRQAVTSTQIL